MREAGKGDTGRKSILKILKFQGFGKFWNKITLVFSSHAKKTKQKLP